MKDNGFVIKALEGLLTVFDIWLRSEIRYCILLNIQHLDLTDKAGFWSTGSEIVAGEIAEIYLRKYEMTK